MGRQLGIPEHLLGRDYEGFLASFQSRLDAISPQAGESKFSLRPRIVNDLEKANAALGTTWFMRCLFGAAWLVGIELLPTDIRTAYQLPSEPTRLSSAVALASTWFIDALYPLLPWLPLRGMIALVCAVEPGMREVCQVRTCSLVLPSILTESTGNSSDGALNGRASQ